MNIDIYTNKRKQCYNKNGDHHNSYGSDEIHSDGYKTYFINGYCHNLYGPASIYPDGKKQYWLDGDELTKEEWEQLEIIKKHNGGEK